MRGQRCHGCDGKRKARREVVAVAGNEPHSGAVPRAKIRKPSCLISCSQPGPEGGALAGEGKHGSIIPNPERVRSRNDVDIQ
jgi:hypothetical protein